MRLVEFENNDTATYNSQRVQIMEYLHMQHVLSQALSTKY